MAEYVHCGFVRSYVLSATLLKHSSSVYDSIVENITKEIAVRLPNEKKKVKMKIRDYVHFFQDCKFSAGHRKYLIELFSLEKWKNLPEEEQLQHRFKDCLVSQFSVFFTKNVIRSVACANPMVTR